MAEELKIIITADTRKAVSGMKKVTTSAKVAMAAIGAAAIAIGTKAVKAATDFGRAMAEVSTITSLTESESKQLTETVKEMSVAMGVDAKETARGLYQTISAGVTDSAEAMEFLNVATKLSIGGLATQEETVRVLAAVMNAYGLSVEDATGISDTLFQTVRLGVVRVGELASSLGSVIPIASAAGISFEEISAAIAVLTKGGLGAERATTALRSSITAILQPSKKMQAAAKEAGFEIGREALAGKGLSGILEALAKLEDKDSEATLKLFENKRALVGMLRLGANGAREFNMAMDGMGDKLGSANVAFEKMNKSAARQFDIFSAKLNVTMIELGNSILPSLIEIMDKLGPSIENIGQTISDNSELWVSMATGMGMVVEGGLALLGLLNNIGKVLEKTNLFLPLAAIRAFGGGGVQDIGGEDIRARAAARGITSGGVGEAFTINNGSTYVQTKDPRDRLEDGSFSQKVAS